MPMLLRLSDIYLRNPGNVEMHTLRGQVERVIAPRVREYSDEEGDSVVLTVILKDMPGVVPVEVEQRQASVSPARNNSNDNKNQNKLKLSSSDDDEEVEFSAEKQKVLSNDPIVMGGMSKNKNSDNKDSSAHPENKAVETRSKMQNFVRVFFYDDWAKALSFVSQGDVLELRTSWHVFMNPETQIRSNVVGKLSSTHEGTNATEYLVTTTGRSDVSVYSKSDQDIIELCFNEQTLKANEPTARVAKGIKF